MKPIFVKHLLWMLLGYALAVLVATTVVVLAMGLPTILPDQGNWGSFYRYLNDFPSMFLFGLMMTAIYGLPGWLITVVTAEIRNKTAKYWFAIAGLLTAVLAFFLSGSMLMSMTSEIPLTMATFVGGFAGGLAYWAVIGKFSGRWKANQSPHIGAPS